MNVTNRLLRRATQMLLLSLLSAKALAADDMHWYITQTECDGAKISIHSQCQDTDTSPANSFCTQQTMTIEKPDGTKIIKENLLEKQTIKDEFLIVYNVACVPVDQKTNYLYFKLSNFGNCPECEGTALMDLDGKWKYFGKHWFVSRNEKRQIKARDHEWYRVDGVFLRNKTEETIKK
jgi:hypothetical protein